VGIFGACLGKCVLVSIDGLDQPGIGRRPDFGLEAASPDCDRFLPESGLSFEWLSDAFPTLPTSATSIVMGGAFASVAYGLWRHSRPMFQNSRGKIDPAHFDIEPAKPARKPTFNVSLSAIQHSDVLWVFGIIHAVIAFFVATWLGATSSSLSDMVFSIVLISLIGLVVIAGSHVACNRALSVIGSVILLVVWCMVARTNTDLAQRLGWGDWKPIDALAIVSLGHSLTTAVISLVLCLPFVRKIVRSERLLLQTDLAVVDAKPPANRSALSPLGDLGLVTCVAGFASLLRWHLPERWLWQSACLGVLAAGAWVIAWVLRGQWRYGVAFLTSCMGSVFLLGDLFTKVGSLPWLPSTDLAMALGFVLAVASAIAILGGFWSARGTLNRRWLGFCVSPALDVCLLLMGLMQQIHAVAHSFDWGRALSRGMRPDAVGWSLAFCVVFFLVCALTAWRSRSLYVWIAGLLSITTAFALIVTWSPGGGDVVAFLSILACAPLVVALCTSCTDAWKRYRKQELSSTAKQGAYEATVGVATILIWGLLTGLGLVDSYLETQPELVGFCSTIGVVWFGIGVLAFAIRSSLETSVRFVRLLSVGTFLLGLNLPIALSRSFQTSLEWPIWLSLLLVGASLYVLVIVWFGIQGVGVSRRILARIDFEVPRPVEATIQLIRNHAVGMSCGVIVSGAMLIATVFSSEAIRLTALSVAMIGFGAFLMDRVLPSSESFRSVIRYLALASWPLFAVYLIWSSISSTTWQEVWCARVLRLDSVLIFVCISLCGAHAWWNRNRSADPSRDPSAETPPTRSMWNWVIERSKEATWTDTLTRQWIEFTWILLGLLTFGLLILYAIGDQALEFQPIALNRSVFGSEVFWIVGLSSIWLVQLIVQAVRLNWNVAQLPLASRSYYVYVAEVVFCLVVLHLYLVRPDWFQLPFRAYWPIVLLVVAVIAQAIAAILKRSNVETVSVPIYKTSLLFPILAPLGMLVLSTSVRVDVVLALSSLFYFFLGATERSRSFAMVGGFIANVALLFFWRNFESLSFAAHPQLWLVPPAVSVAIATHLQRDRLNPEAASWIRYLAMATVFCSSSGEILLKGLGKSLLPPMILMVLSVITVLVGIGLQVRSYLYSGLLFTLFAMVAMVAHAQQSLNHTWPWWVLGITMGIGILVLFGLFERKRDEFTKLANKLRQWDG
jgi:hypothetical protein